MPNQAPKRYSPLWATLHWITALLIFVVFYIGVASEDVRLADKVGYLRWHMPLGVTVFLLTLARLVVRWKTPRPEAATTGNALLDKVGILTHILLYLFALLMPLTGMALSWTFNLAPIVFEGQGSLPRNLQPMLHGALYPLFALLILLHILAALYHQFIRKDNLLARMWFGK